eukprot:PLAT5118.1.p1 GENE.PLAT5118.1~~PLAT5118.1.p1  ORF type:complete len:123 (+),score=48.50 PLAT5118.1:40-369(+)
MSAGGLIRGKAFNVERKVREDMLYAARERELAERERITHRTRWMERDATRPALQSSKLAEEAVEEELRMAGVELKMRRRAALRELYEREMRGYERELNAMGLAIYRDRT